MKFTSKNRTSTSYRMTVKMVNGQVAPEDALAVQELRTLISNNNNGVYAWMPKQYVKLQGRGPRASVARRAYKYPRAYDQSLPLPLAETADVYVYNR